MKSWGNSNNFARPSNSILAFRYDLSASFFQIHLVLSFLPTFPPVLVPKFQQRITPEKVAAMSRACRASDDYDTIVREFKASRQGYVPSQRRMERDIFNSVQSSFMHYNVPIVASKQVHLPAVVAESNTKPAQSLSTQPLSTNIPATVRCDSTTIASDAPRIFQVDQTFVQQEIVVASLVAVEEPQPVFEVASRTSFASVCAEDMSPFINPPPSQVYLEDTHLDWNFASQLDLEPNPAPSSHTHSGDFMEPASSDDDENELPSSDMILDDDRSDEWWDALIRHDMEESSRRSHGDWLDNEDGSSINPWIFQSQYVSQPMEDQEMEVVDADADMELDPMEDQETEVEDADMELDPMEVDYVEEPAPASQPAFFNQMTQEQEVLDTRSRERVAAMWQSAFQSGLTAAAPALSSPPPAASMTHIDVSVFDQAAAEMQMDAEVPPPDEDELYESFEYFEGEEGSSDNNFEEEEQEYYNEEHDSSESGDGSSGSGFFSFSYDDEAEQSEGEIEYENFYPDGTNTVGLDSSDLDAWLAYEQEQNVDPARFMP